MKSAFLHAQKRGIRIYRLLIILPSFTIVLALISMFLEWMYPSGSFRDGLITSAIFILCIIAFIVVMVRAVRTRGRKYRHFLSKYENLPEASQCVVDADLATRIKHTLFGEKYFYFVNDHFVYFLEYSEIAWVYYRQAAIPLMAVTGNEINALGTSMQQLSLMVYDDKGNHYLIQTGTETLSVIEKLAECAPNAIFGYSKERAQMAKWDFDDFMKRERAT